MKKACFIVLAVLLSSVALAAEIKVKRGTDAALPATLPMGTPGMTTDTHRVFFGTDTGKVELADKAAFDSYTTMNRITLEDAEARYKSKLAFDNFSSQQATQDAAQDAAISTKADTSSLGTAAYLSIGTTVGTVAAGDDERIVGALQPSVSGADKSTYVYLASCGGTSIQDAINSAPNLSKIILPRGTCDLGSGTLAWPLGKHYVTLEGGGEGGATIIQTSADAAALKIGTYTYGGIDDWSFGTYAIYGPVIKNIYFKNTSVTKTNTIGLDLRGANNGTFDHLQFEGFKDDIVVNPITNWNFITNIRGRGTGLENVVRVQGDGYTNNYNSTGNTYSNIQGQGVKTAIVQMTGCTFGDTIINNVIGTGAATGGAGVGGGAVAAVYLNSSGTNCANGTRYASRISVANVDMDGTADAVYQAANEDNVVVSGLIQGGAVTTKAIATSGSLILDEVVDTTAYNADSWNGDTAHAPSKDAVRDKIETMTSSFGEANTASNVGTGEGAIFKAKVLADIQLKTIKAGAGVTVVNNADDVTITATGSGAGNVIGPASSTDNSLVQFDGTTGELLKDGPAIVTTLGTPGTDSNVPTEQAVRSAIAAGGGMVYPGTGISVSTGSSWATSLSSTDPLFTTVTTKSTSAVAIPQNVSASTGVFAGGLEEGITYFYVVTSVVDNVESLPSNEVSASTTAGNTKIVISWNTVTGASLYRIYRSKTAGDYYAAFRMHTGGLEFTDDSTDTTTTMATPPGVTKKVVSNSEDSYLSKLVLGTTTPLTGSTLHVSGGSSPVVVDYYTVAAAIGPSVTFRGARGDQSKPTAVLSGDWLGFLGFRGYGATGFSSGARTVISSQAAENWTDTAQGTDIVFETTTKGTTTRAAKVRITSDGDILESVQATVTDANLTATAAYSKLTVTTTTQRTVTLPATAGIGMTTKLIEVCGTAVAPNVAWSAGAGSVTWGDTGAPTFTSDSCQYVTGITTNTAATTTAAWRLMTDGRTW